CQDDLYCNGVERCMPGAAGASSDGCLPGTAPCDADEQCIEDSETCQAVDCATPAGRDADGDGRPSMTCGGDDCDDADDNRFPGNTEVCDDSAHDEDCVSDTV